MPAPSKAIIFKITDAGKQASLNNVGDSASLSIDLTQVGIGTGKYTPTGNETALKAETDRAAIVSGDVETISNTLRFTSAITASAITPVYEIGLFFDDGTLFAVAASSTDPLLTVHPDITFVAAFGLSLSEVAAGSVTVTTDPNGALSIVIMEQHLAAPDPHPQYLLASSYRPFDTAGDPLSQYVLKNDYFERVFQNAEDHIAFDKWQTDHLAADDPHPQYANAEVYKIHDIYLTTVLHIDSAAVTAHHGYGTWRRYAEGRTLVGHSPQSEHPGYDTINEEFGENDHTLTVEEGPNHSHQLSIEENRPNIAHDDSAEEDLTVSRVGGFAEGYVENSGGGQPHNNIQPSIVVAYWLRTA